MRSIPTRRPGAYVNFMMEEGMGRIEATYGENMRGCGGEGPVRPE